MSLGEEKLWGGEFWSDGYFIATVGQHGNADTVGKYVREQGREKHYQTLHQQQREHQLVLFGPDA